MMTDIHRRFIGLSTKVWDWPHPIGLTGAPEATLRPTCKSGQAHYAARRDHLKRLVNSVTAAWWRWLPPALATLLLASCATLPGPNAAGTATGPALPPPEATTAPTDLSPDATVGPLFAHGIRNAHHCTASVLDSPGGNLILTAAHCVTGTGTALQFAPGYDAGGTPDGIWTVMHAYADPGWIDHQDPDRDFVILQVADADRNGTPARLETVTGGNYLGASPPTGASVAVIAYNSGVSDRPTSCVAVVRYENGYPTFDCPGFSGGTSGSPWLTWDPVARHYIVHAVIGGPKGGGCVDSTSYSPPFDDAITSLLSRAATGTGGDSLPKPRDDGC
jgi:V8-like Glu-specific endopeptidase